MAVHTGLSAGIEVGPTFLPVEAGVVVRKPQPVINMHNIFHVFSDTTWVVLFVTLLLLAITMAVTFFVYKKSLPTLTRRKVINLSDMFLRPIAAITEPDPIKWFQNQSSGMYLLITCLGLNPTVLPNLQVVSWFCYGPV